ncbi:MAG: PepSY-associated TM helix domain-containing protein [Bacteroidota bacterium]
MKKRLKKIAYKLHLILGLASGLVVFIVAITGCLWVFQEEVTQLLEGKRKVVPQKRAFISPSKAREMALTVYADKDVHGTAYGDPDEPLEVIFYQPEPEFYHSVFLNPYSGEILGTKDHRKGFFWFVLRGHLYLWLPQSIGSQMNSYGTMAFVVMLFTGIILWWPKNKKGRKVRLQLSWKSNIPWRRKYLDFHRVMGFYVSIIALVIAFSGLIMAFNWVYYVTYKSWGGDKDPRFIIPNSKPIHTLKDENFVLDRIIYKIAAQEADYDKIEVHYPDSDTSSIYIEIAKKSGVYYSSDYRFFDQYSGEELEANSIYGKYREASTADRVIRMNYDIHVGAIGGLPGKIIAFFASLLCASLPVTGFMIWFNHNRRRLSGF